MFSRPEVPATLLGALGLNDLILNSTQGLITYSGFHSSYTAVCYLDHSVFWAEASAVTFLATTFTAIFFHIFFSAGVRILLFISQLH